MYSHAEFFESCKPVPNESVKGRLKSHLPYWISIKAPEFIISTLEHGYVIPFFQTPPKFRFSNNNSAFKHSDFVSNAISDLVSNGCVIEIPFIPYLVNPLSVSVNKLGKKRLILDLSCMNNYVWKQKIKFEDFKVALQYFLKDCYMGKFDLKSGYHHIDICSLHQTFLGFSWKERFYCFTVLPFGLSSAPYIFTKCLRPLVKYWRSCLINIVVYLDDGWFISDTFENCQSDSDFLLDSISRAGFLLNTEKSIFDPIQSLEWLGLIWNSRDFTLSIPDRRVSDLLDVITDLTNCLPNVTARKLAKFTGSVISMSPVLGNVTRLMTRYLYFLIESRVHWDFHFKIDQHNPCLRELFFWKKNIFSLNFKRLTDYKLPSVIIYSDASSVACGAHIVHFQDFDFHYEWTGFESEKSSTWRELKAVYLALNSYKKFLSLKSVRWFSDSQSAVSIIYSGSKNVELQDFAFEIFSICVHNNIDLEAIWIPRDLNTNADKLSKIQDSDNWEISYNFFSYIDSFWGPFTIDRFSDEFNSKLPRFNTRFFHPSSEAVDAFSQLWGGENNWLVPPVSLARRAISHAVACKARGALIVPFWPSSPFWTLIFDRNGIYFSYIQDILAFHQTGDILKCSDPQNVFHPDNFIGSILAVLIDASSSA